MERKLVVKLDQDSRQKLSEGKYQLNIFKGSFSEGSTIAGTLGKTPSAELGLVNTIRWQDSYAGYTSPTEQQSGGTLIESVTALDMKLGDKYILSSKGDATIENNEGEENCIVIENNDTARGVGYCFAFGSESAQNQEPVCVVNASGLSETTIRPKNKYLVTFSSAGTISKDVAIVKINSSACTADYSDGAAERVVWYNYNTGIWAETEEKAKKPVTDDQEALVTNGWFTFIKKGVSILNDVLNG